MSTNMRRTRSRQSTYAEGEVLQEPLVLPELITEVIHSDATPSLLDCIREQGGGQV